MNDTTRRQDGPASSTGKESAVAQAGQMVGPYLLIEPLGRGGLGEVWLARRVSGEYTPEVAIKLVPGRDLGDPEVARRFDRERRILAQLDHPDICRLLDAGRFGPGWPYLVMERIHGRPLNDAAAALDLSERLVLFVRICRAVQYAHRRLVIHRDLKPANLLVTEDGDPRLLDFNTAKLLEADEDPELTRAAAPLTPRYASPEQVRGEALTTASDLFSLGVVLYELIAGESPFGDITTSSYELGRAICEIDPAPPSRSGRGDRSLDAIVARAMHKDPERRYPTADALADDLEAWLERRPISARPVGRMERFGLLLRRHPAASALVGSLAGLVLGASALFFWQMQEARAERDVALAVTEFLETLFEAADPGSTEFSGEDLFAVLDERADMLQDDPPEDPRIAARLMAALGTVQANFGRARPAAELFEASFAARPDLETLVRWANARLELGDNEGAARLFEQAHAERAVMRPAMQAFHAASYAQLEVLRGDLPAALALAEEAASVAPSGSVDEVYAVDTLAQVAFHAGDMERAAEVGQRALAAAIAYYGELHLQVATSRNNLALIVSRLDRDVEALALLEQATDDFEQLLGPEDPRLATSWSNLANRRSEQGQLDAAMEAHANAERLTRMHYGDDHPWVGLIQGYRALTLQRMGRLEEAATEYRQAMAALAEAPQFRGRVGLAQVGNLVLLNRLDAARVALDVAAADIEAAHPEGHPRHLRVYELRALIELSGTSPSAARPWLDLLAAAAGADDESLRLLRTHAAARDGDCSAVREQWSEVDPAAEMKKAALFRAARSMVTSVCD